jgi:hypothetical protein
MELRAAVRHPYRQDVTFAGRSIAHFSSLMYFVRGQTSWAGRRDRYPTSLSSAGNRSATRCSARDASAMGFPNGSSPSRKQEARMYRLSAACRINSAASSGIETAMLGLANCAGSAPVANSAAVRKPRHVPTDNRPIPASVRKRGPHIVVIEM